MTQDVANKGALYMLCGPSGAGKTSLAEALIARRANTVLSISYTTRPSSDSEIDQKHYRFTERQEFEAIRAAGGLLEWAEIFGHLYGTPAGWVHDRLAEGRDVVLEINWEGVEKIRALMPDSIAIAILPESLEALAKRLNERGRDESEIVRNRLKKAPSEVLQVFDADYLLFNHNFENSLQQLKAILEASKLEGKRQRAQWADYRQAMVIAKAQQKRD